MWTIRKIMWLLIMGLSLPICLYITVNEGFVAGKAYMMLVAFGIALRGYGFSALKTLFGKGQSR